MHLTEVFDRVLCSGDTVLDIGAHQGDIALHVVKCVGDEGKVFAFEPHPEKFAALKARTDVTANLTAVHCAVSDTTAPVTLYYGVIASADQASTICTDLATKARLGDDIYSVEVLATTLDRYCADQNIRPDVIKIDVEGAEGLVLAGASSVLEREPLLILELSTETVVPGYVNELRRRGYVLYLTEVTIFTTKPLSWDHIRTSQTEALNDCIMSFTDDEVHALVPFLANVLAAIPEKHANRLKKFRKLLLPDAAVKLETPKTAVANAESTANPLEALPGTQYSRYALPLEYPPSRDLRSRWGYSRPPIPSLHSWFASYADDYRAFISEMRTFGADLRGVAHAFDAALLPAPAWMGTAVNPIDTLALYTFVRKHRPATYLEIGSGITTCFAHLARQHGGLSTKIVSIDPQPRAGVDAICDTIIRDGLETCDLAIFETLGPGDIVFLDGSHRVFMNSDVTVFFIDVLPMLKPGVIVHIHDIALPWDYHQYFAHWYWSEQYMLAVYLMASQQRVKPLFPLAFVTQEKAFASALMAPLVDTPFELDWRYGGSMWFTHTAML